MKKLFIISSLCFFVSSNILCMQINGPQPFSLESFKNQLQIVLQKGKLDTAEMIELAENLRNFLANADKDNSANKRLYYQISMIIHPDKTLDANKNEREIKQLLFQIASEAWTNSKPIKEPKLSAAEEAEVKAVLAKMEAMRKAQDARFTASAESFEDGKKVLEKQLLPEGFSINSILLLKNLDDAQKEVSEVLIGHAFRTAFTLISDNFIMQHHREDGPVRTQLQALRDRVEFAQIENQLQDIQRASQSRQTEHLDKVIKYKLEKRLDKVCK